MVPAVTSSSYEPGGWVQELAGSTPWTRRPPTWRGIPSHRRRLAVCRATQARPRPT